MLCSCRVYESCKKLPSLVEAMLVCHYHLHLQLCLVWYQDGRSSPSVIIFGIWIGSHYIFEIKEKRNQKKERLPKMRNTRSSRELERNESEWWKMKWNGMRRKVYIEPSTETQKLGCKWKARTTDRELKRHIEKMGSTRKLGIEASYWENVLAHGNLV